MHLQIDGPTGPRMFALDTPGRSWVAGRDAQADIHLEDRSRLISRKHLAFGLEADKVRVTVVSKSASAQSSCGELMPGETRLLKVGDHVQLGPYRLTLVMHGGAARAAAWPDPPRTAPPPIAAPLPPLAPPPPTPPPPLPASPLPPVPPVPLRAEPLPAAPFVSAAAPAPAPATAPASAAPASGLPAGFDMPAASPPAGGGIDTGDLLRMVMPRAAPAAPDPPRVGGEYWIPPPRAHEPRTPAAAPPTGSHGPVSLNRSMRALGLEAVADGPETSAPRQAIQDYADRSPDAERRAAPQASEVSMLRVAVPSPGMPRPQTHPVTWSPGLDGPSPVPPQAPLQADPDEDDEAELWRSLSAIAAGTRVPEPAVEPSPQDPPPAHVDLSLPLPQDRPPESPRAAPPAAAHPADAAAMSAAECIAAFAQGLGLDLPPDLTPAQWARFGAALRGFADGYAHLLAARSEMKNRLRAEGQTGFWMRGNNPLKVPMRPDDRLRALLLDDGNQRYLPAEEAIERATKDLRVHHWALLTASRACVVGLVESFDPSKSAGEAAPDAGTGMGRVTVVREARLWRNHCAAYARQYASDRAWFEPLYKSCFVEAYGAALQRAREEPQAPDAKPQ